jgi:outer membrane protein assembly factor BamE (lipoprotein component of BamABCDE complex)
MLVLGMTLASCEPKIAEHGSGDLVVKAGNIIPNQSTEKDVVQWLGTPASTSHFGEKTWFYFSSRNESKAFFAPDVIEQNVLQITFDDKGVVQTMLHYDKNQAKDVAFSTKQTPTAGQKYGFFEQLIGNVGRFNQKQDAMRSSSTIGSGR